MSTDTSPLAMQWGSAPDLIGPRHLYRVGRLVACLTSAVPGGKILDAGCGAGRATEILARKGYRVTAVDDSPDFVTHVSARVARAGMQERVDFQRADLQHLDLPAESFDGAICGEVLEHLQDDRSAARSMARALKPGGALALTVPAGPERFTWVDEWAGHLRRYDEPGVRDLMTNAGLRVEKLTLWGFPFMSIYERFVQGPGLARATRSRNSPQASRVARLARSGAANAAFGFLFNLDRLFEQRVRRGTGFLVLARKAG